MSGTKSSCLSTEYLAGKRNKEIQYIVKAIGIVS